MKVAIIFGTLLLINISLTLGRNVQSGASYPNGPQGPDFANKPGAMLVDLLEGGIEAHWNIEEHPPGFVNRELQEYTRGAVSQDSSTNVITLTAQKVSSNHITSGRLNSNGKWNTADSESTKRRGYLEVRAKFPAKSNGDSLRGAWPAVWMLPKKEIYGPWPVSGEIDIIEARGNHQLKTPQGDEIGNSNFCSTLHFGPWVEADKDAFPKATANYKHAESLGKDFHIYTMEWTEDYIKTTIDGETVLNVDFTEKTMWELGGWSANSDLQNPWVSGSRNAPFDDEYYLILNVAVGGVSGFFPDGSLSTNENGAAYPKPWTDFTETTARDFWQQKPNWFPSWRDEETQKISDDAALQIDYIRVYSLSS